jgi:glycosyltransferase involved in cell wall biosynthesis
VRLVIVHNHLRPGGVRRVIELATPHVVDALQPRVTEVVLVTGDEPDARWLSNFRAGVRPVPVVVRMDPAVDYLADPYAAGNLRLRRPRAFLEPILLSGGAPARLVWVHNPGLGRNLPLTRAIVDICAEHRIPALFHHHDWWFDNRWQRWPEMRAAGFRTLGAVAAVILPAGPEFRHAAINRVEAEVLRRHFGRQAGWLPNLADAAPRPEEDRVERARRWLRIQLGDDAPVWLVASRLLRRKNLAESLLLTRWLRPGAWLVTTGDVSSRDEQAYGDQLASAAAAAGWRLRMAILGGKRDDSPTVPELMAASEVVLLTSLQEGFGLPFLEAAAARRPLIARALGNVVPDLTRFGFHLPYLYREVLIAPGLFDWDGETRRQSELFRRWRDRLPGTCRSRIRSVWLSTDRQSRPVPFSRLTLTAQLEILQQPAALSWKRCLPLNPLLARWKTRAASGALRPAQWPASADRWLSGAAYARRLVRLLGARTTPPPGLAGAAAQDEFIRRTLREENLFPLTWDNSVRATTRTSLERVSGQ